ncbi:Acetyl esterase/lipase [Methylophilus rhizosphaerae]|uniref:Acetyl esterase/lipase n=1 Tax=Methylophilus rhizosphaerae TaxID=492660 RepID=A0A1G9E960_9PROT|nr:alpha/beta hydrolase [Methylophilus rhizosphaerae]SDK72647.1 Acetyl esterase/lipase [Methylophilus rhizosphaerae]
MWTTSFEYPASAAPITLQVFGKGDAKSRQAALIYFHGGLFNCGSIETAYDLAHALSEYMVVVCVAYPLAPAMQFPDTIEVAYQALAWVCAHAKTIGADAKRIFVGGEQAGGNLAAVVSMLFRDRGLNCRNTLQGQILINPMLDALQTSKSLAAVADSPCRRAWADYTQVASNALHPYVSPVNSCRLGGLVPAMIISSDSNPLRDEAETYATKLLLAGVPVQVQRLQDSAFNLSNQQHPAFDTLCQLIRQFTGSSP